MSLWVPPSVSRDLREETAEYNHATLAMFELNYGLAGKWNKPNGPLRKFDPLMRVGKAYDNADGIQGVVPGFYHLIRINPGNEPIWCIPIHDNGRYAEPSEELLQMMRNSDMQNPQVLRDKERMAIAEDKSKQREKLRKREEREGAMMEAWRNIYQPKVSFGGKGWTNSVDGKRGRLNGVDG